MISPVANNYLLRFIDVQHDKEIQELANDIIEVRRCKELNWAILDYAALVCKTRNPLLEVCSE